MIQINRLARLPLAALAAASLLASCATPDNSEAEAAAAAEARAAALAAVPPVTLNEGVAQAASIYVSFIRNIGTVEADFQDAESIQSAIQKGAAYDPAQLSRGMIAYASILALQSPEFVAGVRQYAVNAEQRRDVINNIKTYPGYAATLPGADAAAGLILATLDRDIDSLTEIANNVEDDAYRIQERADPRRQWAVTPIPNREVRLESAKSISAIQMLPSGEDSTRLFAAGNSGAGLETGTASRLSPPYTPAIANALSIAALAALGAAGEDSRASTDALTVAGEGQQCLELSKLNLYQCLAASRPSYEDIFCLGRHIVRDLATCTSGTLTPIRRTTITVSNPIQGPAPVRTPATSTLNVTPPQSN